MPANKSRYQKTRFFTAETTAGVFKGVRARVISPATGILEYVIKQGDRLDLLALYFYNDSSKWWRLLDANPDIMFAANLTLDEHIGRTIQVPRLNEREGA